MRFVFGSDLEEWWGNLGGGPEGRVSVEPGVLVGCE